MTRQQRVFVDFNRRLPSNPDLLCVDLSHAPGAEVGASLEVSDYEGFDAMVEVVIVDHVRGELWVDCGSARIATAPASQGERVSSTKFELTSVA